jgi:glycerol-3-phosphate dehydrogenase
LNLNPPLTREDIIAERWGVRPLVIKNQAEGATDDWLQLSRKHEIDVDQENNHISIFGGKLTDCVNVGDEVSELVRELGIELPYADYKWYGEPHPSVREEYLHQAKLMNLDNYTSEDAAESLTSRLWRRYDEEALRLLDEIREDPSQAEVLIKSTEYIRCEIYQARHREMIVKLEDFLRRRSKIALVERHEDIKQASGLMEACEILFGDQAQEKFDEYFQEQKPGQEEPAQQGTSEHITA